MNQGTLPNPSKIHKNIVYCDAHKEPMNLICIDSESDSLFLTPMCFLCWQANKNTYKVQSLSSTLEVLKNQYRKQKTYYQENSSEFEMETQKYHDNYYKSIDQDSLSPNEILEDSFQSKNYVNEKNIKQLNEAKQKISQIQQVFQTYYNEIEDQILQNSSIPQLFKGIQDAQDKQILTKRLQILKKCVHVNKNNEIEIIPEADILLQPSDSDGSFGKMMTSLNEVHRQINITRMCMQKYILQINTPRQNVEILQGQIINDTQINQKQYIDNSISHNHQRLVQDLNKENKQQNLQQDFISNQSILGLNKQHFPIDLYRNSTLQQQQGKFPQYIQCQGEKIQKDQERFVQMPESNIYNCMSQNIKKKNKKEIKQNYIDEISEKSQEIKQEDNEQYEQINGLSNQKRNLKKILQKGVSETHPQKSMRGRRQLYRNKSITGISNQAHQVIRNYSKDFPIIKEENQTNEVINNNSYTENDDSYSSSNSLQQFQIRNRSKEPHLQKKIFQEKDKQNRNDLQQIENLTIQQKKPIIIDLEEGLETEDIEEQMSQIQEKQEEVEIEEHKQCLHFQRQTDKILPINRKNNGQQDAISRIQNQENEYKEEEEEQEQDEKEYEDGHEQEREEEHEQEEADDISNKNKNNGDISESGDNKQIQINSKQQDENDNKNIQPKKKRGRPRIIRVVNEEDQDTQTNEHDGEIKQKKKPGRKRKNSNISQDNINTKKEKEKPDQIVEVNNLQELKTLYENSQKSKKQGNPMNYNNIKIMIERTKELLAINNYQIQLDKCIFGILNNSSETIKSLTLKLSKCGIQNRDDDSDFQKFLKRFSQLENLTNLVIDIGGNNVKDNDMKLIFDAIKQKEYFEFLDLTLAMNSEITDITCYNIANCITKLEPEIIKLDLSNTTLTRQGKKALNQLKNRNYTYQF